MNNRLRQRPIFRGCDYALRKLVAALMLSGSTLVVAAEPVRLATWEIPGGWVVSSREGVKVELVQEAARRAEIDVEISVYPPKRAIRMFEDGDVDGMFPAMDVNLPKPAATTEPYFSKHIYCLTRAHRHGIHSLAELAGKRIGLVAGYSYPPAVTGDQRLQLDYASSAESNIKKLLLDRIDVFLEEHYALKRLVEELALQDRVVISEMPLSELHAFLAFQPDNQGRHRAAQFSGAIKAMSADGTLDRILSKVTH